MRKKSTWRVGCELPRRHAVAMGIDSDRPRCAPCIRGYVTVCADRAERGGSSTVDDWLRPVWDACEKLCEDGVCMDGVVDGVVYQQFPAASLEVGESRSCGSGWKVIVGLA